MDDDLHRLLDIIEGTPGVAAQLALAHKAAKRGEDVAGRIHCAIAADALAIARPDVVDDPVVLARVLQRLFVRPEN